MKTTAPTDRQAKSPMQLRREPQSSSAEPVRGYAARTNYPVAATARPNHTGLPDQLKAGIENLSGHSLDDVQVHYNSTKPAQLQALAYAQGTDIHVAPGQEKHLPHEAWHVVQQKQGRVEATRQLKGVGVNDDSSLEKEADVMGGRAVQGVTQSSPESIQNTQHVTHANRQTQLAGRYVSMAPPIIQKVKWLYNKGEWKEGDASNTDTNHWPKPQDHPGHNKDPKEGYVYDQNNGSLNTGEYTFGGFEHILGSRKEREKVREKAKAKKEGNKNKIKLSKSKKTFGGVYMKRSKTAYGFTSGTGLQGPHSFPHIGKRAMFEAAKSMNKSYKLSNITPRTGIMPSPGQNRALLRLYQENSGIIILRDRLKKLDLHYRRAIDEMKLRRKDPHAVAVMELNAMATGSHGRLATDNEIGGKEEDREVGTEDVTMASNMTKDQSMPEFKAFDKEDFSQANINPSTGLPFFPVGASGFPEEYVAKYVRDIGTVARGEYPSDMDLASDSEYSDLEPDNKKKKEEPTEVYLDPEVEPESDTKEGDIMAEASEPEDFTPKKKAKYS